MMRTKLKHGIIIIVFIIIFLSLNYLYSYVENNKSNNREETAWQENKHDLDYAFFGDSHVMNAIMPEYINNSYNFAIPGEGHIEIYYKIQKLIFEDNITIKNIVLQLDAHSFSEKLRAPDRTFNELNYYSGFVPLQDIAMLREESIISILLKNKLMILGKGEDVVTYLIYREALTPIHSGWINNSKTFDNEDKTKLANAKLETHFNEERSMDNISQIYFDKILNLAEQNNISIIIIRYPVSEEYYSEIQDIKVDVDYDYHDMFFNDTKMFGDSDHLNWKGAEVFSKFINQKNSLCSIFSNTCRNI